MYRTRESAGMNYRCRISHFVGWRRQEFLLPPWEMDGIPRAKDELGVDLCPEEQKLIYCLPKEGLD
jgi:hypothetical protein